MQPYLNAVKEFHDAFGIQNADHPFVPINEATVRLRHNLMAEENDEYLEAALAQNTVEIADALGDQLYILCGTLLAHGMGEVIDQVFSAIQASNMSKLGADGRPIYREDGKVLKGPGYFRPDIASVLDKHSARRSE
jgi:predicted HAD superfamily Cof-like phosphohydrolase